MRKSSVTDEMIAVMKQARIQGYYCHEIAAYFGINQGRVAEVNTGQKGAEIRAAGQLPDDFPPHRIAA